jgi:hypothetical protein
MNIMNIIDNKLSSSQYSGRVLVASAILVIVMFTAASLIISYDGYGNTPKVLIHKPKVGMVTGVLYSPPNSLAVVGDTIVHEGESIRDIAVVAILSDAVEFSKVGLTWRQEILETPHRAWKQ